MKRHRVLLLVWSVLALWVAACGSPLDSTPDPNEPVTSETPVPTPAAATKPPSGGVITGEAVVESIEVLILESFPVQVHVVAKGYLADGCTEIGTITSEQKDDLFLISITTVRPADKMCTEAIVPFEEVIPLDVYGLAAGTYTVDVNGVKGSFELQVDNVPAKE